MFTGGATLCLEGIVLYSQQLLKYMKYMLNMKTFFSIISTCRKEGGGPPC